MKNVEGVISILGWAILTVLNAGFLNADMRHDFQIESPYHAREVFGMAFGLSLLPPMWIVTPFFTGFYYQGWTLEYKPLPCTETDEFSKKLWCKDEI